MTSLKHVLCATVLTLVCMGISSKPAIAQSGPDDLPSFETQVLTLKHANAYDAAEAITNLEIPVQVSAVTSGQLLLRGSSRDVLADAAKLVRLIDVPAAEQDSRTITEFIPLRHVSDLEEVGKLLNAIVTPKQSVDRALAIDYTNRMLVVKAAEPQIAAVRRLIAELDHPARILKVSFFFLRAEIGGESAEGGPDLPAALQPIALTLADSGFGSLSLMAPMVIMVEEGRRFSSQALLRSDLADDSEENLRFQVAGIARLQPGLAQLDVEVRVDGTHGDTETGQRRTELNVETSFTALLGQHDLGAYGVLAAAPSSTATGGAIAVVAHVIETKWSPSSPGTR